VGRDRLHPLFALPGFQKYDRLLVRLAILPQQGHEPTAVANVLKVHADGVGLRVVEIIFQDIAFVDVQLVAYGGDVGNAEGLSVPVVSKNHSTKPVTKSPDCPTIETLRSLVSRNSL